MEVDKSMTTRKQDAESIIGEELAEEIDKEAKLVGKSEALVIKAKEVKCPEGMDQDECRKWKEEHDKDRGDEDTSQRGGKPDQGQNGGKGNIVQAPTARPDKSEAEEDCDCDDPKNAEVEKCKGKKKEMKSEVDLSEALAKLDEIKSMLQPKSEIVEAKPHILDAAISKLKADFDDAIVVSNLPVDDRLKLLQPAFDQLGEIVKEKVSLSSIPVQESVQTDVQSQPDVVKAFVDALQPIQQQLGLLSAQMAELKKSPTVVQVPERRSLNPQLIQQKSTAVKSETPHLREIIERTTN